MKAKIIIILILLFFTLTAQAVEIIPLKPNFWEKTWNKISYCKWRIPCYWQKQFGVTITNIAASDTIKNSRTTINDNFTNLNDGKIENATTSLPMITTLSGLTSAAALATVGTITTGTWTGTAIGVAKGGTGTTSPAVWQVMLGNGSSGLTMASSTGSSGQFLTSNGANAFPSWQTSSVNQTDDYNFTGTAFRVKNLHASSTAANPIYLNGIDYNLPAIEGASSTMLMTNGSGSLNWVAPDWELLVSTTTSVAMVSATTTFAAANDLRIVIYSKGMSTADISNLRFNGDYNNNYGWNLTQTGGTSAVSSGVNVSYIALTDGVGTSTPGYLIINISNESANAKIMTFNATFASGASVGAQITGGGVWNNTSAQITTLTFGASVGSTYTLNSGTIIRVYGRK